MNQINKHLKTQTNAVNLFLQSILSIVMGFILIYNYNWFFTRVSIVVFAYFWFVMGMNFIQVIQNYEKGIKEAIKELFPFLIFGVAVVIYYLNINRIIRLIPPVMIFATFVLAISSFISYMQYRKEDGLSLRYLLSALLNLGFCIAFALFTYRYGHYFVAIKLIGIYLVILGGTLFLNGVAKVAPDRFISRRMGYLRITPPAIVTAFAPIRILNRLHGYFKINTEDIEPIKIQKSDKKDNVQVYVHVAKSVKGIAGHVDIAIDDTISCYGTYDRENLHLGGIIGTGVLYEVYDKEVYLDFCKEVRKETIFEYGLALTEEELEKVREKLVELKSRTCIWKCKSQRALEEKGEVIEAKDMSCKLAQAMETVFYKFKSGTYKYYWMFGFNCVKFTDELIRASGMKTVLTSIITPGTYFTFLNDEFARGNSRIVSRTVYYTAEE